MSKISLRLMMNCLSVLALPFAANAAGTYYTGSAYQPVQYRYGQSSSYASSASSVRNNYYSANSVRNNQSLSVSSNTSKSAQNTAKQTSSKRGFYVNAGITHENAMWQFEMKNVANSILHYDNVAWNVFDLNGGYIFNLGKTKMQVDAGFKYGMQWGEATMNDDDITNGGFAALEVLDANDNVVDYRYGHALSVGTSKDGDMLGFNVGFGLTDFWKIGNIKITPSIGYRYLKYKLETSKNYGLSVVSAACVSGGGETQCDPLIYLYNADSNGNIIGTPQEAWRDNATGRIRIYPNYDYIDTGDTYYFEQSGISHSYDVEWAGPYIALDMVYDINQYNSVNGRIEMGFPGYTSTGDQPYRWDWAHPKSVEDSAGMFSAFHLGLSGNWITAITNNLSLSVGVTYDYYTVGDADADTYLNKSLYNQLVALTNPTSIELKQISILEKSRDDCGGWVCKSSKEIDSIYKSMGIRVGIEAKF